MKKILKFFLLGLCLMGTVELTGCSGGQTVFYWQNLKVGGEWFARDHSQCLAEADFWPWTAPSWPLGSEPLPELRFDNNSDNGIWANFIPYPGAQEVYVNSLVDDWSMSPSSYESCMEDRGYTQRKPSKKGYQVLPE